MEVAMAASIGTRSARGKGRAREEFRQQGLRPIEIWVPDVRSPAFAAEAHRQSLAVAESPHQDDDQAFIDAVSLPSPKRGSRRLSFDIIRGW
jgi:hypothetical protein